jgi:2-phosphosulfolactate phosphatase
MPYTRSVRISCYQRPGHAAAGPAAADRLTVCVDVFRATTTAVTAVTSGRRCFPVASLEEALPVAAALDRPLLVGELGGSMPYGFDLQNSPAAIARRPDVWRPAILLSTSGTPLLTAAAAYGEAYAACLRNWSATADHLIGDTGAHVDLVGAGTRGEFREEDQLCCAWIASKLMAAGFTPVDAATGDLVERWRGAGADMAATGKSADYLRDTGQAHDIEFVLSHVDDVASICVMSSGELVLATDARPYAHPVAPRRAAAN